MAAGLAEAVAGSPWASKLTGWVNVPADCVRDDVPGLTLHAGRPAGKNEPRPEGVAGTRRILDLVRGCGPRDLCVVLLSGGGSALLVAPADGVTLEDKQRVTKLLAGRGADIGALNAVRRHLSAVKGGGLARACGAGRTVCLAISDVIGDRPEVIASGPTVADPSTAADALAVLRRFCPDGAEIPPGVLITLRTAGGNRTVPDSVTTRVIGSNAVAQHAAVLACAPRGLQPTGRLAGVGYVATAGVAREVGRALVAGVNPAARRVTRPPTAAISGGEPTVTLCENPGRGGRNQEVVLAAVEAVWNRPGGFGGAVVLSGGTDGEDGPTDAAGAVADDDLLANAKRLGLHPRPYLDRNSAYEFFRRVGGLLKTGPTHTNVMDLRVVLTP